ncbi:alpha-hydroxy-acid oxidizing protein [Stackebrandtia nassauensis]|uniref:FMN-dependent alpha-hydroxy acid dehydrogenase n=1 Tax=Stackebrandtia nassauensis (strain DSM 44728 / CIP 108903 / NRRL B-16338 / NBRC 102104 / LLR-40K-21) TaxID=446470 RepID=D3Q3L8_STANL|nr:alpha-hydroxy-acid oxidizing protein [Stackebrandtia nassauensis]ADD42059.1 FMN-dependent alpha-hydroxy acid dehydrogenase [Stackebrandtia nassauensis DSM 44728]
MRESVGRAVQSQIYRDGVYGRKPAVPVAAAALRDAAHRRLSKRALGYVAGSAGLETTATANRAAFDAWRVVPHILTDVSERDLGVDLFGRRRPTPYLLAPIGVLDLVHPEADLAVARAATDAGVPMIVSSQASTPMEDIAAAIGGGSWWFQLYWSREDALMESFVSRAEKAGAEAIVVTLDTHLLGWRPRDLDDAYLPFAFGRGIAQYTSDPVFTALVRERATRPRTTQRPTLAALSALASIARHHPGGFWTNLRSPLPRAAVETFLDVFSRPTLTWDDLEKLRQHTTLPILLKGVLHPDDAVRAVDSGVDGIVVSNHGGRQIDGAIASLEALPRVVTAVEDAIPVLFDSGIRGGADAYKALALGAHAVCLGRPYVYGLTLAGTIGVRQVLSHFIAELDLTLGLSGCTSIPDITRDTLRAV